MRLSLLVAGGFSLVAASPALARDDTAPPPAWSVAGSAAIVSDYRFRGVSRSDDDVAAQFSLALAHESGAHLDVFATNVAGWGSVGGADVELDVTGGYRHVFDTATADVGVTWYSYPGGKPESDIIELFGRLSGTLGPVGATAGIHYAPRQTSLGTLSGTRDRREQRGDNLYLAGDGTLGIPGTPITGRIHLGRTSGNPGPGPLGTSLAPTGTYWDWSLGADVAVRRDLTLGVGYVDTDIGRAETAYLRPAFSRGRDGTGRIAGPTIVVSLTAAF